MTVNRKKLYDAALMRLSSSEGLLSGKRVGSHTNQSVDFMSYLSYKQFILIKLNITYREYRTFAKSAVFLTQNIQFHLIKSLLGLAIGIGGLVTEKHLHLKSCSASFVQRLQFVKIKIFPFLSHILQCISRIF